MDDIIDIIAEIAKKTGISCDQARLVSEALLETLHKRLVEYRGLNGDYLGECAHWELSNKAFFHLLGLVGQFSKRYSWDEYSGNEYLNRLPPVERWDELSREMADWKWNDK